MIAIHQVSVINTIITYFKETFNIFNYNYALAFNEDIFNVFKVKLTL